MSVRFFVPKPTKVFVTALELETITQYYMRANQTDWSTGWNTFGPWKTGDVLDRLSVPLSNVGVLAYVGNETSGSGDLAPLSFAAALTLGYLAAVATEYVPRLPAAQQADVVKNYQSLAAQMGLPAQLASDYGANLARTSDRETAIAAMFEFKGAVVAHLERLELRTAQGAQRQLEVWQLGWNLAVAALGQGRGADSSFVTQRFDVARAYAGVLDIRIPALPDAGTGSPKDTATAISYLLNDVGKRVPDQLDNQYGPQASGLFELALRATLTMLLYGSGNQSMDKVMTSTLERAGRKSGLPAEIYGPLVSRMTAGASSEVVSPEVTKLNDLIRAYFEKLAIR